MKEPRLPQEKRPRPPQVARVSTPVNTVLFFFLEKRTLLDPLMICRLEKKVEKVEKSHRKSGVGDQDCEKNFISPRSISTSTALTALTAPTATAETLG